MSNDAETDDYAEFHVSFEEYEQSKSELKAEIIKMIRNKHSNEEINQVLDNGIYTLITMAFNFEAENLIQFGLYDTNLFLKTAKRIIEGDLRKYVKQHI